MYAGVVLLRPENSLPQTRQAYLTDTSVIVDMVMLENVHVEFDVANAA